MNARLGVFGGVYSNHLALGEVIADLLGIRAQLHRGPGVAERSVLVATGGSHRGQHHVGARQVIAQRHRRRARRRRPIAQRRAERDRLLSRDIEIALRIKAKQEADDEDEREVEMLLM